MLGVCPFCEDDEHVSFCPAIADRLQCFDDYYDDKYARCPNVSEPFVLPDGKYRLRRVVAQDFVQRTIRDWAVTGDYTREYRRKRCDTFRHGGPDDSDDAPYCEDIPWLYEEYYEELEAGTFHLGPWTVVCKAPRLRVLTLDPDGIEAYQYRPHAFTSCQGAGIEGPLLREYADELAVSKLEKTSRGIVVSTRIFRTNEWGYTTSVEPAMLVDSYYDRQ